MILEIVDAKTFRNLRDAVAQEMADTLQRAIEAEALAVACNQLQLTVRSKLKTGAKIDEALQKRYESQFGYEHDIATELDDVGDDRKKVRPVQYQTVFGPITNLQHVALATVARDRSKDVDRFCRRFVRPFRWEVISMNRSLRADLVDHASASIWEIKPISSASLGVWQEAAYRLSFNLLRELVRAMEPENSTPRLNAGGAITGSAAFRIYRPFPLSALTDPRGVIALAFHVSFLPGLLPYLLVKGPNEKQVVAAAVRRLVAARQEGHRFARPQAR